MKISRYWHLFLREISEGHWVPRNHEQVSWKIYSRENLWVPWFQSILADQEAPECVKNLPLVCLGDETLCEACNITRTGMPWCPGTPVSPGNPGWPCWIRNDPNNILNFALWNRFCYQMHKDKILDYKNYTLNTLPCTRDRVQTYSLPSALFRQAAQEHQYSLDPPGD